jgi:hypothetical protein
MTMTVVSTTSVNVKQAVPFFGVTNMEASLRFYLDGLGFKMKHWWIPSREEDMKHWWIPNRGEDKPDGRIRWWWLELGDAAIMLQEFLSERQPRRRWALEHRSVLCAKMRWRSIASSNHVEFRRGNTHSLAIVFG